MPLRVMVSAYPLAQLVEYVGGDALDVVDLAPPGVQPQDLSLTPARREMLRSARLVIDVGDGYQPEVEAAAVAADRRLAVLPKISDQPRPYQFWLDPYLMARAADVVAASLIAADPRARTQFVDGARNFQSVAASIESDFESTLTECAQQDFVTADDAFARMAASFDLDDVAVDAVGVNKASALVRQRSLPAVFSEAGAPSGAVEQVAHDSGARVESLDPMEVTPFAGTTPLDYFGAMEENLNALQGPLACDTTENFS